MVAQVSADDAFYMAMALRLAERGLHTTDPNPRVGCILVRERRIVGAGWHRHAGGHHAEIEALQAAGEQARGASLYVTLEPCCHYGRTPPCCGALIQAGVSRVIAAMQDPNPKVAGEGLRALAAAGIETACGLLEDEAKALNPGFCRRMRRGLPWVFSKLAMSLDGRTALASGESRWITSEQARRDVHRLRARSSAILTGVGTVLGDDPALTARLGPDTPEVRQPLRVVLDSQLRTPASAKLARGPGRTLILTVDTGVERRKVLESCGFEVGVLPADRNGRVNLAAALEYLGAREINELMVEAGSTLNGSLLSSGLLDELFVYLAPCILGDDALGLFHLAGLESMSERYRLKLVDSRMVGVDLRLRFRLMERGRPH